MKTALNSPWALWVHGRDLYIAMAGPHQIWKMPLGRAGEIGPFAGNGAEDIVDGPLLPDLPYAPGFAAFAQPSGLASDGKQLFVADSEGSSIRAVPFNVKGSVTTLLGTASLPAGRLFTFGDVDGQGRVARLQHPLDVLFHEGMLYIADTYNNKIKVLDPETTTLTTLAGTGQGGTENMPAAFDEPAGLALAGGKLYVADTNNHAIRTIDLKADNRVATLAIKGLAAPELKQSTPRLTFHGAAEVDVPPNRVKLADGKVRLHVALELPDGIQDQSRRATALPDRGRDALGTHRARRDRQAHGRPAACGNVRHRLAGGNSSQRRPAHRIAGVLLLPDGVRRGVQGRQRDLDRAGAGDRRRHGNGRAADVQGRVAL